MIIHIDFETQSDVDLRAHGAEVYAESPRTVALCLGYAFGDEPVELWRLGDPPPTDLFDAIKDPNNQIRAHNAPFELAIWNKCMRPKFGWPLLPFERVHCTMALAYAMGLPGSLEKAAAATGLEIQKDTVGGRIMLQLSQPKDIKPDGTPIFYTYQEVPEKYHRMYSYCITDVEVERLLDHKLLALSKGERRIWELDFRINQRGVGVDLGAVKRAVEIVEREKERLDLRMRELTDNGVATCDAVAQYKAWYKLKTGEELESLDKDSVNQLLKKEGLDPTIRETLLIRQQGGKSSNAKLQAMKDRVCRDGRIRSMFQYYGAPATGRWAGRGVQLQNLPRPEIEQGAIEDILENLHPEYIELMYGPVMPMLSSCIRGMLIAGPGKDFIGADFSAIEARVLAWLAGQENVLEIFRGDGKIYEHQAAMIYGCTAADINKDQRQIGKVAVLALGYQGGVKAFQTMAKNYSVRIPDEQAEYIKKGWRQANPNIVRYWQACEDAALSAVMNPGNTYEAGPHSRRVLYKVQGSFLWCRLPSGRSLAYPYPEIKPVTTPWGQEKAAVTYMCEDSLTKKWVRTTGYGGLFTENITQGAARDLLAGAMIRLEDHGLYPVVIHVHDEVLCEVFEGQGSVRDVEEIMSISPSWAIDLPIRAEGWRGKRYRK